MLGPGDRVPSFKGQALMPNGEFGDIEFSRYRGRWMALFFWPMDFTFVCPTEIIAFQNQLAEFEKRNVAVVGCSVDSQFSHWKWLNTDKKEGGIKGVTYPLVSDQTKTIARSYDVLAGHYDYTEDEQVVFVGTPIAPAGVHASSYRRSI